MSGGVGRTVAAGAAYFALVFAIGFVFGTIRVLLMAPRLGEHAVSIELPIMLMLSWFSCLGLVDRFTVPPNALARLSMGAVAFALLMFGELAVSIFGFGRTLSQHAANYFRPLPALGLAAQVLFAIFPFAQWLLQPDRQKS
ncbi:MAG: hypothetical protein ACKVP7_08105 [Hyphomicrobiaceae bacterium]